MLSSAPAATSAVKVRGDAAVEGRWFEGDDDRRTEDGALSAAARVYVRGKHAETRSMLRIFGRVDVFDPDRNRFNVEEAYLGWRPGAWRLRLGAQILNWTATEAFHPADIVNSRNFDSNVENAEKIGEPMLSARRALGPGSLMLYFMPLRLPPQVPGGGNRLGFAPPGFDIGTALWAGEDGSLSRNSLQPQGAIRYRQVLGDADATLHVVRHHDRSQPLLRYDPQYDFFRPIYLPATQFGGTYQHVLGAWVFKLEAAYRMFNNPDKPTRLGPVFLPDHAQTAFGVEYSFDEPGGAQTTLILEGQSVLGQDKATRADLSLFQRDLLAGFRRAFNDAMGREIFGSVILDAERSDEYLFNLSYSQRLSDVYSVSCGGRLVQAPQKRAVRQGLEVLDGANQLFLTLKRHF